jgi:hypothetical protein
MDRIPTKDGFMNATRSGRRAWQASWEHLDEAQLTQPGRLGTWSIKDMIAHVTWHERQMCMLIQEMDLLAGSDLWNLPLDERNAAIYALNKDRPLPEVLQEVRAVIVELLDLLETLSEEDFHEASHFANMPAEWKPWSVMAGNTYAHYQEHMVMTSAHRTSGMNTD